VIIPSSIVWLRSINFAKLFAPFQDAYSRSLLRTIAHFALAHNQRIAPNLPQVGPNRDAVQTIAGQLYRLALATPIACAASWAASIVTVPDPAGTLNCVQSRRYGRICNAHGALKSGSIYSK